MIKIKININTKTECIPIFKIGDIVTIRKDIPIFFSEEEYLDNKKYILGTNEYLGEGFRELLKTYQIYINGLGKYPELTVEQISPNFSTGCNDEVLFFKEIACGIFSKYLIKVYKQ